MILASEDLIIDHFKGHYGCIESIANYDDRLVVTTIQLDEEQQSIIDLAERFSKDVMVVDKWTYVFTFSKEESQLERFLEEYGTKR